jgi:FixJ family two-component response regulator
MQPVTTFPPSATVFIVEDDPELRDTMCAVVEAVGLTPEAYGSGTEFLDKLDGSRPGCIVLDIRLPGMSGLEVQRRLKELGNAHPIIVVSGHADVPTAVKAMKNGAVDLLQKPFSNQALLDLVQRCIEIDAQARKNEARRSVYLARYEQLTAREKEVMALLLGGDSTKKIANRLDISPKTVETHRANVMSKMKAASFADLVETATLFVENAALHRQPADKASS